MLRVLVDGEGVHVVRNSPPDTNGIEPMSREELFTYIGGVEDGEATWVTAFILDDAKMKDVVELARAVDRLGHEVLYYDSWF